METQINSARVFATPTSQDGFSAMLRAQALFKEDPDTGWQNRDVIFFFFHALSVRSSDYKLFGEGFTYLRASTERALLAF